MEVDQRQHLSSERGTSTSVASGWLPRRRGPCVFVLVDTHNREYRLDAVRTADSRYINRLLSTRALFRRSENTCAVDTARSREEYQNRIRVHHLRVDTRDCPDSSSDLRLGSVCCLFVVIVASWAEWLFRGQQANELRIHSLL